MSNFIKLSDAVTRLVDAGVLESDKKQKEQAVKRLLNQGLILGEKPPKNQPKIGWQVDVESLTEYIEIGNMAKGDMVKELLRLRREIKTLKNTTENKAAPVDSEVQKAPVDAKSVKQDLEANLGDSGEKKIDSDNLKITNVKVNEKTGEHTYSIEFVVNGETFTGILGTEGKMQLLRAENIDRKLNIEMLQSVMTKAKSNITRKVKAFDKK